MSYIDNNPVGNAVNKQNRESAKKVLEKAKEQEKAKMKSGYKWVPTLKGSVLIKIAKP